MRSRWVLWSQFGVLLLAGLFTWLVFQKKEAEPAGQVILDVQADQVKKLAYHTANRDVLAEALPDGQGFWLDVSETLSHRKPKAKPAKPAEPAKPEEKTDAKADAKPEEKPAAEPEPVVKETRYRASPDFAKSLARVLPLAALRELPEVGPDKLAEFGLENPEGTLSLVSRGQTVEFAVGKRTFGRSSVYLRRLPDGPVSLVSSGLLSTVDFRPPRYKELRFFGLPSKDVEQVFLDCGPSGRRTLVHQDRFQASGGTWAPVDAPQSEDALYGNWMGKLLRLSLVEYLDQPPAEPPAGAQCRLVFQVEGGKSQNARLTWLEDPSGKRSFYGKSDFSRKWVKLDPTASGSLISDLSSILGKEPPKKPAIPKTNTKSVPK